MFVRGGADKTLFVNSENDKITIAQIYFDDIVFGSTYDIHTEKFTNLVRDEFEVSVVGELSYFLGLHVKQ